MNNKKLAFACQSAPAAAAHGASGRKRKAAEAQEQEEDGEDVSVDSKVRWPGPPHNGDMSCSIGLLSAAFALPQVPSACR
jgi:hypothetical protein